jgi:hypothetical protein
LLMLKQRSILEKLRKGLFFLNLKLDLKLD